MQGILYKYVILLQTWNTQKRAIEKIASRAGEADVGSVVVNHSSVPVEISQLTLRWEDLVIGIQ